MTAFRRCELDGGTEGRHPWWWTPLLVDQLSGPSNSFSPRRSARSSFRIDSRRHSKTLCFTPSFSYSRPRSSPSTCTWAPFFKVAAKSANLPNETQRCHSVRDSQAPSEFFHERCVATANAVKADTASLECGCLRGRRAPTR